MGAEPEFFHVRVISQIVVMLFFVFFKPQKNAYGHISQLSVYKWVTGSRFYQLIINLNFPG